MNEDNKAICLECKKEFEQDTDIQLCAECSDLFLLEDLWEAHDNNILDALDFNENAEMRERYRLKKCCWNEETKKWYELESTSPSEYRCLGCYREIVK